jgi:integrase
MQRLWYAARVEAQLEGVRLHDLRHSVASFAGGRGYSLFLIGKLLGHKDMRSTARYAHLADDIRMTMADDIGEGISSAMAAITSDVLKSVRAPSSSAVPARRR